MQITVSTKDLQQVLELVSRVSTKHVTLPVLQCVLIEATKTSVSFKATNLEIGVEANLSATIEEEGVVAVPASVLLQTVNLITQPKTTLRHEDNTLVVESAGSETQIKCISHEEFPTIPKLEGKGQTINNQLFSLGIKTAAFAVSQSSIKPELGSIYVFQKKEHTLTFVSTDSFRLVEKTVSQKGVVFDNSVLLPQKNAVEIARICESKQEDPICRVNDNQLSLEFSDGLYITSRLTTGSFPDYEQIIPKEYSTHTTLLRNDFLQAFKKTSIFLNKFFQVSFHVTTKSLTISANNNDVGTTTESISAQTEGEDLTLSFNQRYVSEALPHFTDDSITLHFAGIGRPLVIKGLHDNTLRYLVMPMNK